MKLNITRTIKYLALLSILCFSVSNVGAEVVYSAGFIEINSEVESDPDVGVWYPSAAPELERKWGPFKPKFAWNGPPAVGRFPVILFSHGVYGRYRNHRDTAASLARAGYIVVAPQHRKDSWVGSNKTVAAIEHRAAEVLRALQIVRVHKMIGKILNDDKTAAIGYSLGTLTILTSYGVLPSYLKFEEHCTRHGQEDANLCTFLPWWQKLFLWFKDSGLESKAEFSQNKLPLDFQAIALVGPIGAIFTESEINKVNSPVAIFRLGDDKQLKYPFHAEYLYTSMKANIPEYKVYKGVHHYAFISPFPKWLLEEEHIPVGLDPPGFDRTDFLDEINADIVRFFKVNLPVD